MEEGPSLSPKITKSETKLQLNNHRSSSSRCGGSNNTKHQNPDLPAAGQVAFRILCHVHTAGGVIGSSGSIIRNLEVITGSKIRFEEGIPNCPERVINIIGDASLEKKISVGDEMVDVSKAQEGLMRVFERVLEVEGNVGNNENEDNNMHYCNGAITCRLLAQTGQIGALMGKGGKIVDGIRKSSGARIRVFKNEQTPLCAGPEEELIQIMGGVMAVKKALVAVSRRLQDRTFGEGVPGHMSTHGGSHNLCSEFTPKENPTLLSVSDSAVEHSSVGHSLSTDVERIRHIDVNSSLRKVLFRFLCSNAIAGGVIGKDGNIVKYLEKETGASIKFASPVSRSKERLVIITSLEHSDPLYSPAQIAIVRVFTRCIEVCLDQGVISSLGNGESVLARILIDLSQVSCMLDENGRVASDISVTSGAEIQLIGADDLPNCAGVNDNVVQISGDYDNVKSALFQLAGRLRENFFSGTGPIGACCKHSSHPAIRSSSPNNTEAANSVHLTQLSKLSSIDQLDHLGFVQKSSSSHLQGLLWEQAKTRESCPRPLDSAHGMAASSGRLKHESNIGSEGSKTVEVMVPREVFPSVYGENGSNLARLREISGATVVLKDPCPGESSGKVSITGTPERIQIAQSLLHAFISF